MTSGPWIRVSVPQPKASEQQSKGVVVSYHYSPHDLPVAVRGSFDAGSGRVVIEFKYLDTEVFDTRQIDDYVALRIGKNSARLLGMELNAREIIWEARTSRSDSKQIQDKMMSKLSGALRRYSQGNKDQEMYSAAFQA